MFMPQDSAFRHPLCEISGLKLLERVGRRNRANQSLAPSSTYDREILRALRNEEMPYQSIITVQGAPNTTRTISCTWSAVKEPK
jgi:hypothetical protein